MFFESAGELVQNLNDQAMQLEKAPGDAENLRSLRRTVHTLKGDAAACGFRELSELAHEFEDVLALEKTAAAASVPRSPCAPLTFFRRCWQAYRTKKKLPSIQSLREDIARLAHPRAGGWPAKERRKSRNMKSRSTDPLVGIRATGHLPSVPEGRQLSSRGGTD